MGRCASPRRLSRPHRPRSGRGRQGAAQQGAVGGRDGGRRNVAIKIVALAGNVVFARLLAPSAMGTVAFGLTMLMLVQLLSDGGLGVGLIRRPEEPALEDLRVLLGYQLALTLLLACVIAAVSSPLGRVGEITAVMMIGLPLLAFRAPSSIVYERNLDYRPLLTVEVLEELTYYTWGVSTVLLGAGVWGLASASIAKALVGTVVMLVISPVGRLSRHSWRRLRPMLGFGLKFQAVEVANTAGAQLLNLGIAGIGGLAVLGLWTLAWRIAMLPFLLFSALWRVSYPATAKLLAAGESARTMVEGGIGVAAVATGLILAPATGALSPLIPAVFGARWGAIADVLPLCFFALQASGGAGVHGRLPVCGRRHLHRAARSGGHVGDLARCDAAAAQLAGPDRRGPRLDGQLAGRDPDPLDAFRRRPARRSSGRYSRRGSQRRSRVAPAGCSHATSVMAGQQPWAQAQRLR